MYNIFQITKGANDETIDSSRWRFVHTVNLSETTDGIDKTAW